jgi:RHS repeat-associated protein
LKNRIIVFAGQYYDSETGLHYNYFRYYDPKLGRYLRADPIGLDGGTNIYSYVSNDPVNTVDPWGLYDIERRLYYPGTEDGCKQYCEDKNQVMVEFVPDPKTGQAICVCKPKCGDDKCDEIIREINGVMKGLHRRYLHQCRNKKGQWETHRIAFDNEKIRLGKLVRMAEECGCSVPPKAYIWLNTKCPLPGTPFSTTPGY